MKWYLSKIKNNIDFYINVEKSRSSIKNYDIHNEILERELSFQSKMRDSNYYLVLFTHSNKENIHNYLLVIQLKLKKFN